MKIKKLSQALLIGGMAFGLSSAAIAGEKKLVSGASAAMLANTCAGCHGTDGVSTGPATPSIAGLSVEYFIEMMEEFKEAETPSTIMTRIAKGYSGDEIKAMAAHFGKMKFVPAKQGFDKKLAKAGAKLHDKYCEKCHADGGTSKEDDSGILAGQWTPYLKATMSDYINFMNDGEGDKREPTKKMKKKVKKLLEKKGHKGVEALMHFYASKQ